jgi:sugar lactone lactonase YvrE
MRSRFYVLLACLALALPLAATAGAHAATIPPGIVVVNDGANALTSFSLSDNGNVPPAATVATDSTSSLDEPAGIALDAAGDAWVTNSSSDTIAEYSKAQLAGGGTQTPLVTLTADAQDSLKGPTGVAFDAAGDLWVVNSESDSIVEYTPGQLAQGGAQTPAVTLTANSSQSLAIPYFLAFDAAGDLWVPNYATSTLVEFTPDELGASGDPTPATTIASDNASHLKGPVSIAFDAAGDLWTASSGTQSIVEYTPSQLATGAPMPANTVSENNGDLAFPAQMAFDSAGDLWVADYLGDTVEEFDADQLASGGSPTPVDMIQGGNTGLDMPESVAIEQAPTVSSLSTDRGPSGTRVTISGAGFYPGSTVDFGATPAVSVTYVSSRELTAVAPPGSGAVDVTVSTGQGSSATSSADVFTYAAIASVTPTLVVGNDATGTLTSFPLSDRGEATPASSLSDSSGSLNYPIDGALDSAGDLWVPSSFANTVLEYTRSEIVAGGNQTPAVTLRPGSANAFDDPSGAAFDAAGNLWVTSSDSDSVVEYTKSELAAGGAQVPAVTIVADGSNSLDQPIGLDFDAAGNLWVSNFQGNTVVEYTKSQLSASGAPAPAVTLSPDSSGSLATPDALTFDRKGDLWVSNGQEGNTVVEYTPSQFASGAPTPAVTLSSDGTGSLDGPDQAQFDAAGDLWVANFKPDGAAGSIVEFTPSQLAASGSPIPQDTIAGGSTGLGNPWLLVIAQAPTVSAVSPATGLPGGGTQVTISGTGFYPGSTVDFAQAPAASVTYVSPYELTAVAPAGTGTVDVTVSTGQGTSDVSAADQFVYAAPVAPAPSAISPPVQPVVAAAVTCTLKPNGNKVLLAAPKAKAKKGAPTVMPGAVTLTVKCDAPGKVKLTGTLTELIGKKPKHGKQKSKTYKLRPVNGAVKLGCALTLKVKLPVAAVTALGNGGKESATFTAVETGARGGGRATAKIAALAAIR